MDQIIGRGSGKILLFGEHAAVYGHPAVGCGLNKTCTITLTKNPELSDIQLPSLNKRDLPAAQELLQKMRDLVPDTPLPGGNLSVESNIPESAGMGSSAAVCSALAQILLAIAGEDNPHLLSLLPEDEHLEGWSAAERRFHLLWHIANDLEQVFHGTPSGIDTAISLSSGTLALFPQPRQLPDVLPLGNPNLPLIIGALPRQSSTKELVAEIRSAMIREDDQTEEAMEFLGDCSHTAITLLESGSFWDDWKASAREELGTTMTAAHECLTGLGLSTQPLNLLLTKAEQLGALGGKMSGAGGGGTFIILAPSHESIIQMSKDLNSFATEMRLPLLLPITPMQ
jgi:mevalonate kinase